MSGIVSFWELITNNEIIVPIIQRDYVQGRNDDSKIITIRKTFVNEIYEYLSKFNPSDSSTIMNLDFIYGKLDRHNKQFYPIDGQQRLTTLWLLHWFLAAKSKDTSFKKTLKKFSYKTRNSAKRFCEQLAQYYPTDLIESLSAQICSNIWYSESWSEDQTVKSMLVMLDELQTVFKDNTTINIDTLIKHNAIVFQFLDMDEEEFTQSDSLYIKMNARGKPLTDFENFKSYFEGLLEKNNNSRLQEFKDKSNKDWQIMFWKDYKLQYQDIFMQFINIIAVIEHYVLFNEPIEVYDFDLLKKVYSNISAADFLFSSLNSLLDIRKTQSFDEYFETYLSSVYSKGKVCIFQPKLNLLDKYFNKDKFTAKETILFFSILYMHNNGNVDIDKLRVIRNLLQNSENELRAQNLPSIYKETKNFLDDDSKLEKCKTYNTQQLENELEKNSFISNNSDKKEAIIELESLELFQGKLSIIDLEKTDIFSYLDILKKYFGCDTEPDKGKLNSNAKYIARLMFLYGDYSQRFGLNKVIANNYETLSTLIRSSETEKSKPGFNKLLDDLKKKTFEDLEQNIDNLPKNEWVYYFSKYPIMSNFGTHLRISDSFDIRLLKNIRITGKWVDPYLYTLKNLINNPKIIYEEQILEVPKEPLIVNDCHISSYNDGWRIEIKSESPYLDSYNKLCFKYNINDSLCVCQDTQDRIEIGQEIINEILSW